MLEIQGQQESAVDSSLMQRSLDTAEDIRGLAIAGSSGTQAYKQSCIIPHMCTQKTLPITINMSLLVITWVTIAHTWQ